MSDLRVTLDENTKEQAEALFKNMGISLSNAVKMFIKQSINEGGFPFKPYADRMPNEETLEAFKEVREGKATHCSYEEYKKEMASLKNG